MGKFVIEDNPQVAYWKAEAKKNDELLDFYRVNYEYEIRHNRRLAIRLERMKKEMEAFNALPWWKKMFFKFDLL